MFIKGEKTTEHNYTMKHLLFLSKKYVKTIICQFRDRNHFSIHLSDFFYLVACMRFH